MPARPPAIGLGRHVADALSAEKIAHDLLHVAGILLVIATDDDHAQGDDAAHDRTGAKRIHDDPHALGDAKKGPSSQAKVLTRAEFDALLAKPEQVLILDVRRPDEIKDNGGFPVYLSIQAADLEKNLAWIPRDRTIVTVSNHANRGGRAADLLASHGFKVPAAKA